jgi:hypothetical protein
MALAPLPAADLPTEVGNSLSTISPPTPGSAIYLLCAMGVLHPNVELMMEHGAPHGLGALCPCWHRIWHRTSTRRTVFNVCKTGPIGRCKAVARRQSRFWRSPHDSGQRRLRPSQSRKKRDRPCVSAPKCPATVTRRVGPAIGHAQTTRQNKKRWTNGPLTAKAGNAHSCDTTALQTSAVRLRVS